MHTQLLTVLNLAERLAKYSFQRLKALLLHIVKHPLGSLFWIVKAYLALMFLSIFVACSFGAYAQTAFVDNEPKPAKKVALHTCQAVYNGQTYGTFTGETFSQCAEPASEAILAQITLPPASETVNYGGGISRVFTRTFEDINVPSATSLSVGKKVTTTSVQRTCYANSDTNWQTVCNTGQPETSSSSFVGVVNGIGLSDQFVCPPEGYLAWTVGPDLNNLCNKPTPKPSACWPDGGSWSQIPLYHFSDSTSAEICAQNDQGKSCPWKQVSKGVFQPAPMTTLDCDNQTPEPPPPPPTCTVGGNGMKVCPNDPNQKCATNGSTITCEQGCGLMNGIFMCFSEPPKLGDDPSLPDQTPKKPVNDELDNPTTKTPDMTKQDFKQVQRGLETRVENLTIAQENAQKTNDALLSQLNTNTKESNRSLAGIERNTKAINDNLTIKTTPAGLKTPELDSEKNNWETRNFGTIAKEQGDKLMELPLFTSVKAFFDVSFSGSCPTYSTSVWVFEVSIDQFCSPTMNTLWPYIKAVILLICSFFAIRIALL